MRRTRRSGLASFTRAGFLGLAIGFAACSDSPTQPGPGGDAFDTQTAKANFEMLEELLDSPEWAAYRALSNEMGGSGIVAARVPGLEGVAPADGPGAAAVRLLATASRVPLISSGHLGVTFVIDPLTGQYTPDPDRTGAPSNGVRFVLYDVIPGTEDPDPENEIGHVDLVDNGATAPGIDLRLTATANGITFIDYGVAIQGDESSGSVDIDGFLSDGTERLDFTFGVDASDAGGTTNVLMEGMLSVVSHDFRVTVRAEGTEVNDSGSLDAELDVRYGSESLQVDVSGDPSAIDASFRVNGELFATATGSPEAPVILGADGEELSQAELDVLGEIIRISDDIFDFFEDLLEPAEGIILIAVIL